MEWVWPNSDQLNDYPDPVGFESEWKNWTADLSESPSVVAEIFSREYIQNSVDSIKRQSELVADLKLEPLKTKAINFKFVKLEGEKLRDFVNGSGLAVLRSRFLAMSQDEKERARLSMSEWLTADIEPNSLNLLICNEVSGIGMFGHWWSGGDAHKEDSLLKLALIQTQSEKGSKVSGGSWGHGKKAIANASKSRLLLVYTCFIKRAAAAENDSNLTRRAIGVAYWKKHVISNVRCQGLGIFGERKDKNSGSWTDNFFPLNDEQADKFVTNLGLSDLEVRTSAIAEQCGTSYVIVEPAFNAIELASAIERNWWPLILRNEIELSITDELGDEVPIAPDQVQSLAPFLKAYDLAAGKVTPEQFETCKDDVKVVHSDMGRLSCGRLGLTSDTQPEGWSYSERDNAATLIALVRGDMLIAYQPSPPKRSHPPFLRGVFVVDSLDHRDAAQILRLTEPHLHNEWRHEIANDVTPENLKFAGDLLKFIDYEVKQLRQKIKGIKRPVNSQFRAFTDIFKNGNAGVAPPPPPRKSRLFSIQYPNGVERVAAKSAEMLVVKTLCKIGLQGSSKKNLPDSKDVRVTLSWSVLEDGLKEDISLFDSSSVIAPAGFTKDVDGSFIGQLKRGQFVEFEWSTKEFSADWTVAPTPFVESI